MSQCIPSFDLDLRIDGPTDAPAVVLANSLGTDIHLWDDVVRLLEGQLRFVRFEYPGHGRARLWPADSAADIARALLRSLSMRKVHRFAMCGVSLGGAVAAEVALQAPQRVESLLLSNTAATFGSAAFWNARIETAAEEGMSAIAEATLSRWLVQGPAHRAYARLRSSFEAIELGGYLQCAAIVRDHDSRERLRNVNVPTTVVVGEHDLATPPTAGRELAQAIAGARVVELPSAHLACADCPEAFASLLRPFGQPAL